jgi:hypothetical protein
MSCCSFEDVSTTTGNKRVRVFPRSSRKTSSPSTFGSFKSSSTTCGNGGGEPACLPRAKR